MTVVVFFDKSPLKNMISTLSLNPDKVIFVSVGDVPQEIRDRYKNFMNMIPLKTVAEYYELEECVEAKKLIDVLCDIVAKEDDCVFDLTGGDVLAAACMGVIHERYRGDRAVRVHRFFVKTGEAFDVISGKQLPYPRPELTIEQVVALYGGKAAGSSSGAAHTDWQLTDEFRRAIEDMWDICCDDPSEWNEQTATLAECESTRDKSQDDVHAERPQSRLSVTAMKKKFADFDRRKGALRQFLNKLSQKGLVSVFANHYEWVITYQSQQIRRCLSKEGNLLEAKMLLTFTDLKDRQGEKVFHEVKSSVHIDWDGVFETGDAGKSDTHNEIDLMMMRGVVPVFVSCKNGLVKETEVFKFSTVARHFGGDHAGKLLVATFVNHKTDARLYVENRLEDMGVALVKNVHSFSNDELRAELLQTLFRIGGEDEKLRQKGRRDNAGAGGIIVDHTAG